LGPGPRLIKKRIYRAAVSQRLRNTEVEVSASGWSLVQWSHTECVCVCVCDRIPRKRGGPGPQRGSCAKGNKNIRWSHKVTQYVYTGYVGSDLIKIVTKNLILALSKSATKSLLFIFSNEYRKASLT